MIRLYTNQDREALIELLRLNTPEFFDASEEKDFIEYLELYSRHYFVMEEGRKIVGAGGVNYMDDGKTARISWDMVHPEAMGKGLGSRLTRYRIEQIKKHPEIQVIAVRTSQFAFQFYQKFNFRLIEIVEDFWAEGIDLYHMELPLK
ncbi:GNAT family N-acetyltransferase [Rapidithrix thailandica]|uniref:GNAT family N-acetyltransferase n=1 Tax=Rapidithrix thailandica TaxID=413964 RepID=A0AAW9S8B1_9BACT